MASVQISNDFIQYLYDRLEFVNNPNAEAVGIDDVANRVGQLMKY
nr:hypothetical protein [Sedimentibacter sp.]